MSFYGNTSYAEDHRCPDYNFQAERDAEWLAREIARSEYYDYISRNFDSDDSGSDHDETVPVISAEESKRKFDN
jgi:hypothetical protein